MAAMATLDVALLSDEMLRLVVAFVPEERKAWSWTKKRWCCRLLRLKEIRRIMHILAYRMPPGSSQDFVSQLTLRFLEALHLRNSAYKHGRARAYP